MFAPRPFAAAPRPAFGRAEQHVAEPPSVLRRGARGDARRKALARSAAELAALLPDPDGPPDQLGAELIMTGRYDLCQVACARLDARPSPHLRVATLCYSKRNAADLLAKLAEGRVGRLTLAVSTFFTGHNAELHEWFRDALAAHPGSVAAAIPSHCKVVCFGDHPERPTVFRGSANLRANSGTEQLTADCDGPTHDFYAAWIDRMAAHHAQGD